MSSRLRSPLFVVVLGVVLCVVAATASLCVGVIDVGFGDVVRALRDFILGERGDDSIVRTLVVEMRLPRAIGALLVGASLGTAGCVLQAMLRDPLASPSIIGTAQAAGFGRVLGVYLGLSYVGSLGMSFATAMVGTLIVLSIARSRRGLPTQAVLLTGVNVGMLFAALIGLVQYLSTDEGQLSRMVLFLLGGLWQVTWQPLAVIAPLAAIAIALAWLYSRQFDLLALGEDSAVRLGLDTRTSGTIALVLACGLTSLAVSIAGIVAFVGLVVPHAARWIVGPSHAALIPASACLGGLLVLGTDAIARTAVPPNELPLGVLTSLIGVPFFVIVLHSMVRRGAVH